MQFFRKCYKWFSFEIIISIIFLYGVLSSIFSCANTSMPPMGGPKDTIPPVLLSIKPDSSSIDFPISNGEIVLTFDEYVILKDVQKNLYTSPPLKKMPKTKIRGKNIIVDFQEKLDSNTTYSLFFRNSIVDNNEGNPFYQYVYTFSTGKHIDSLMTSGNVYISTTLLPAKDVTVAFYKDDCDSVLFNSLPDALAKTDDFGYFVVRNLKPIRYRVYAFRDLNNNNLYDPENEEVAFIDSLFIPSTVMNNSLKELIAVGEKDTLLALSRPSQMNLYMFKENPDKQFIRESKMLQPQMAYIKFFAPWADVDSLSIDGINSKHIKKEFNIRRDSLTVWITDTSYIFRDTLKMAINYMKTDTNSVLSPFWEELTLVAPRPKQLDIRGRRERLQAQEKVKREDLLEFEVKVEPALLAQQGFRLEFKSPLSQIRRDSIFITSKNPRGDTTFVNYLILEDSLSSRFYNLLISDRVLPGHEYTLNMLPRAFTDIYRNYNDTVVKKGALPREDRLSGLSLEFVNVDGSYIVEITNVTRDRVFRTAVISKNGKVSFPYLQAGKYSVKIIQDLNGNGVIDPGILLQKIQPEKVRLYTLASGSAIISLPESTELNQVVDIKELFSK